MELADRACVPCKGGVPPLTEEERRPLLSEIDSEWSVFERPDAKHERVTLLARTYAFKNFVDAMTFANGVGSVAEDQQHHPDLFVAWGKVGVEIWTHKIGGLTESDFVFAAKCDRLFRVGTTDAGTHGV
jgi:4a-hydroxytetrahydrobiopterin dehydratase